MQRCWVYLCIIAVAVLTIAASGCRDQRAASKPGTTGNPARVAHFSGVELELQAVPGDKHTPTPEEMKRAVQVMLKRIDPEKQKAITTALVGTDRIDLGVPDATDPAALTAIISQTGLLEFVNTADRYCDVGLDFNQPGTTIRAAEYAKYQTILTGADLINSEIMFNSQHEPLIICEFTPSASDKFGRFTKDHVGQYLTILLDGKVLSSPIVKAAITDGTGMIDGHFSKDEAQRIVDQLNSGTLPFPLRVLSSKVVGPGGNDEQQSSNQRGSVELELQVPGDKHTPTSDEMQRVMQVVRKRLDPQDKTPVTITLAGMDRIKLQVPGATDPAALTTLICQPALLEFVDTADKCFDNGTDFNQPGTAFRAAEYAKYETILTGADLAQTEMSLKYENRPAILLEFEPGAAEKLREFSINHINQYLAVLLDGKVLENPIIKDEIKGGKCVILSEFTTDEAQRIVSQLNAGALPVPLKVISSTVSNPKTGT